VGEKTVSFQQATIPVVKEKEFHQLRDAIERVFTPPLIEKFLGGMQKKRVKVRDFESVLAKKLIERADPGLGSAQALYEALALSDKAQVREFYLVRLEQVDDRWREKFRKVYVDY
jgi:hypothetical protein